jgi:hypothetical protein
VDSASPHRRSDGDVGRAELFDGRERARAGGRRFSVTPGVGNVRRVLWISGVLGPLCGPPDGAGEREADDEASG